MNILRFRIDDAERERTDAGGTSTARRRSVRRPQRAHPHLNFPQNCVTDHCINLMLAELLEVIWVERVGEIVSVRGDQRDTVSAAGSRG